MTGCAPTQRWAAVAVLGLALGCGSDRTSSAGAHVDGGHPLIGAGGLSGEAGTSAGGGSPSSTGGNIGTAGAGGSISTGGAAPSLGQVDLTLGGLNQDLPAPTLDCVAVDTPSSVCLSWTGTYQGAAFDGSCRDGGRQSFDPNGSARGFECGATIGPSDDATVGISLGEALLGAPPAAAPRTFSASAPPQPDLRTVGDVVISRDSRKFVTHDYGVFQIGGTHDYAFRIAGISAHPPSLSPGKTSESVSGTFAATATPKATCVPDASGYGCDSVRIRGTFHVRTMAVITP